MGRTRRVGPAALIVVAGAIAYFSSAAGEAGPMVVFGRGDANRAAADAWQLIPLHAGIALGFTLACPIGLRRIARAASIVGTVSMALVAASLLIILPSALGDRADVLDMMVTAALVVLYGAALVVLGRLPQPVSATRPA